MCMFDIYSMYDYMNPKPVLEAEDLNGKDRKAYDIIQLSHETKVDHRKVKWAYRYLKAHNYEFVSHEKAEQLRKEHEAKRDLSKKVMKVITDKFPIFDHILNNLY